MEPITTTTVPGGGFVLTSTMESVAIVRNASSITSALSVTNWDTGHTTAGRQTDLEDNQVVKYW